MDAEPKNVEKQSRNQVFEVRNGCKTRVKRFWTKTCQTLTLSTHPGILFTVVTPVRESQKMNSAAKDAVESSSTECVFVVLGKTRKRVSGLPNQPGLVSCPPGLVSGPGNPFGDI